MHDSTEVLERLNRSDQLLLHAIDELKVGITGQEAVP